MKNSLFRPFRNYSLRAKLIAAFLVVVLISSAASFITNSVTRNELQQQVGTNLDGLAHSQALLVGNDLSKQIELLNALALNQKFETTLETINAGYTGDLATIQANVMQRDQQWLAAYDANNKSDSLIQAILSSDMNTELFSFQKSNPDHIEIFMTDKYGAVVAATNFLSGFAQQNDPWWQAVYNNGSGGIFFGLPEFDESTQTYVCPIAVPITVNETGEVIGVLRSNYQLTGIAQSLANLQFGKTGNTSLVFSSGDVLESTGNRATLAPEVLSQIKALSGQYDQLVYQGKSRVVSSAPVISLSQGKEYISALGWTLITDQDPAEALRPVSAATSTNLLISLAVLVLTSLFAVFIAQTLSRPILQLTKVAEQVRAGDLSSRAEVGSQDEVGRLAQTFNDMTAQVRDLVGTLEHRVTERTHSLELAAEVGRSVSQVRALDVMLKDATEIIRSRFDLYYVQVYLTNPSQTALILQSGTGTVGAELIGRGHQLPLNTASINGRAVIEKRSVVVADTAASTTFKPNPLLPDTRSEMAVPLLIGEKVVGVLDLQSQRAGALNQDILTAFEALAGQLAIAIQNATFLAETEQARVEVESQARRQTRANWDDYMDAIHKPEETGFVFEQNKITPMIQQSQPSTNENSMTAPIAVTGEALGNLVVEMEGQAPISRSAELVNTVARQVAQQIESLRLLDSAERYRFEAEEASRRLTREGWKDYMDANAGEGLSFIYDLKEVRPNNQNGDQQIEESAFSLPLKVRDEIVGKLVIQGLGSDDKESLELANAVAERLGAHIESLRQFEETQRGQFELDKRARQLAAVAEVSSVSSRELDINKMLASVVHLTQRQFGLYHAHIFTYNENTTELKIAACGWKEGDEHEGTHGTAVIPLAQEQSLVARSARTRQPVIANDVHNEAGWLPNPLLPDTASEMAVPLIIGDQILGVLDVQSETLNAFSEEDANIYATLASQVSTALQNAHSFVRAQQQAERESTLNIISQKIQSATTVEAVLQIAARELGHALGAPMTIAQLSMKDKK